MTQTEKSFAVPQQLTSKVEITRQQLADWGYSSKTNFSTISQKKKEIKKLIQLYV